MPGSCSGSEMEKKKKPVAFEFVLERLYPLKPMVRPMFGAHGVYIGEKIVLIMRDKENNTEDNGVWVAVLPGQHASLKKEFPSMRSIRLFGPGDTGWQNIPSEEDNFETEANGICDLLLKNDPRIGKVPKGKSKKKKK